MGLQISVNCQVRDGGNVRWGALQRNIMIKEILKLAAKLPAGLPDPKAADKLIAERAEFRQAIKDGDSLGALTELADIVYYACKAIDAGATEAGVTLEMAFAICEAKYKLRAQPGNPKNDKAEREAVLEVI